MIVRCWNCRRSFEVRGDSKVATAADDVAPVLAKEWTICPTCRAVVNIDRGNKRAKDEGVD